MLPAWPGARSGAPVCISPAESFAVQDHVSWSGHPHRCWHLSSYWQYSWSESRSRHTSESRRWCWSRPAQLPTTEDRSRFLLGLMDRLDELLEPPTDRTWLYSLDTLICLLSGFTALDTSALVPTLFVNSWGLVSSILAARTPNPFDRFAFYPHNSWQPQIGQLWFCTLFM